MTINFFTYLFSCNWIGINNLEDCVYMELKNGGNVLHEFLQIFFIQIQKIIFFHRLLLLGQTRFRYFVISFLISSFLTFYLFMHFLDFIFYFPPFSLFVKCLTANANFLTSIKLLLSLLFLATLLFPISCKRSALYQPKISSFL